MPLAFSAPVEDPRGAPRLPLIFLQNLSFALARDPRAPWGPKPPGGENPRGTVPSATPEDPKNGAGPHDPAVGGDHGARRMAIRQAGCRNGDAEGRRLREEGNTSLRNLLLSTIFLAPALAVSHFRPETRQSRQSRRGFLRRSSDKARQCQALKRDSTDCGPAASDEASNPTDCWRAGWAAPTAAQRGTAPARGQAEAVADAMGITFYVVRNLKVTFSRCSATG